MRTVFVLVLIVLFSVSCKQKTDSNIKVITTMNDTRPIDELKDLVLLKGDTGAFEELAIAYLNEKYDEEFLIYSMVMANKYNYPRAYYYVYYCLTTVFEHHSGIIDESTKVLAIKYIMKGSELKDPVSMKYLGGLYLQGKYVPKDTILGKRLEAEGRNLSGF